MMLRHSNPQRYGVETYGAAAPNLERCGALLYVISLEKLSSTRVLGYTAPGSTRVHNIDDSDSKRSGCRRAATARSRQWHRGTRATKRLNPNLCGPCRVGTRATKPKRA
ncbi:hypothetical protein MA16_Dca000727 [Dendrobium catenatum]|uniref:Uncharacterized protein n=1 Tax=Dendrobium catenatum TaxID=906689 RepID=A0A2I0WUP2_9ASPA|nr:hypothetical protein MA16_Dca000727 [Dendrobium catenatum]